MMRQGCLRKLEPALGLVLGLMLVAAGVWAAEPSASMAGRVLVLSTLEWPPYTDSQQQGGGRLTRQLRAELNKHGVTLDARFMPWSRAVASAERHAQIVGYFPEYLSDDISKRFHCTKSLGNSPLGFASRRGHSFDWHTQNDLGQFTIGVVKDYVNETTFDQRVAAGQQRVETVGSDVQNLRMLLQKRVDAVVIDRNVMEWLLDNTADLAAKRDRFFFHDKLLAEPGLHICLRRNEEGLKWQQFLDAVLLPAPSTHQNVTPKLKP